MANKLRRLLKRKTDPSKRHVRLFKWMLDSAAWRSLDPAARAVLIELYSLYNGSNNGFLYLSVRQAALRVKINKDTASRCFATLRDRGFIRRRLEEPTHWSEREARYWILTEHPFPNRQDGDGVGTRDFMKWKAPEKQNPRPEQGDATSAPEGQNCENCERFSESVRSKGTEKPIFDASSSETEGHRYYHTEGRAGAAPPNSASAMRAIDPSAHADRSDIPLADIAADKEM